MTNPFTPEQQRAFYNEVWANHDPATGVSFATCPNDGYRMTARVRKTENLRADLKVICPRCGEARLSRELDPRVASFRQWTDDEKQEMVDRHYQARPISCPVDGTVLQATELASNVSLHCDRCGNTHFGSVLRRVGTLPLRQDAEAYRNTKVSQQEQESRFDIDRRFEEIHGVEHFANQKPLAEPSPRIANDMNKRYQVFVSSTYEDLKEERQFVTQALLRSRCIPAGMELFPASDDEKWTLIKRVIDDCDYFLLILAGHYGSTGSDGIGYTEKEYDYAVETGKPIIAFLHSKLESIPFGMTEQDPKLREKLEAFRDKAKKKIVQWWSSPDELAARVSTSLPKLFRSHPETFGGRKHGPIDVEANEMKSRPEHALELFFSYSHKDDRYRKSIDSHLSLLKREGLISNWFDHRITAGKDIDEEIKRALERARVVLLLVSSDFIASDYCFGIELGRAVERHNDGTVRVIPIIVRPCDWHSAPFGNLKALPRDGKPITKWSPRDDALLDIAKGIREVVKELDVPGFMSGRVGAAHSLPPATAPQKAGIGATSPHSEHRQPLSYDAIALLRDAASHDGKIYMSDGPEGFEMRSGRYSHSRKINRGLAAKCSGLLNELLDPKQA